MSGLEGVKPGTKVVVRLLPPSLTEEQFLESVPSDFRDSIVWFRFCKGKRRKTFEKPSTNSRAYINFPSSTVAFNFWRNFHGHSFVDEKGEVFKAVACFAPYPQVPRSNIPVDKKVDTMSTDPLYLSFLASLETSGTKPPVASPVEPALHPVISPLVLEIQERHRLKMERQAQLAEKKKKKLAKSKTKPVVLIQKRVVATGRGAVSSDAVDASHNVGRTPSRVSAECPAANHSRNTAQQSLEEPLSTKLRRCERRARINKKTGTEPAARRSNGVMSKQGQPPKTGTKAATVPNFSGTKRGDVAKTAPQKSLSGTGESLPASQPTIHRPIILLKKAIAPAEPDGKSNFKGKVNPPAGDGKPEEKPVATSVASRRSLDHPGGASVSLRGRAAGRAVLKCLQPSTRKAASGRGQQLPG